MNCYRGNEAARLLIHVSQYRAQHHYREKADYVRVQRSENSGCYENRPEYTRQFLDGVVHEAPEEELFYDGPEDRSEDAGNLAELDGL